MDNIIDFTLEGVRMKIVWISASLDKRIYFFVIDK